MSVPDAAFDPSKNVVAICGGVGGAKLALGLKQLLGDRLSVVINVADDFDHMGLRICPDLDTVIYTLGGLSDEVRGWGRADETWNFMAATKQLLSMVTQQAYVMSFIDVFMLLTGLFAILAVGALLMRKPEPVAAGAGGGH